MQVSEVSKEDGIACAQLIKCLQVARFDNLGSKDMEAFLATRKWVADIALKMAAHLNPKPSVPASSPPSPSPTTGMSVKAMGPLGSGSKATKRK